MLASLRSPAVIACTIVLVLSACGAWLKLNYFGTTLTSDYQEYVETAMYFGGGTDEVVPQRLLKPLNPLLIAGMSTFMPTGTAFLLQALVFYFALAIAVYFLAWLFFRDCFGAALIALMVTLSYPVLRYGVEINTETGALFLYVLSLILTFKFIERPSLPLLIGNTFVVTVGFLWKEYSIVAGIIFGLAILFHATLSTRLKAIYVALYGTIFLAAHIPWQLWIWMQYDYSYLSWYTGNVTGGIKSHEFSLRNIVKSTAALIGLAWLAVPFGLRRFSELDPARKFFLRISLPPPFIGYLWGYISSRLLYVMAPPFLLVAYMEMRAWKKSTQAAFTGLVIAANIAWLFLSYRITL